MKKLKAKEFIQSALIDEVGDMVQNHPYMSFIIMGIGIEFLGKCIDTSLNDWNKQRRSKRDFEDAIKNIPSLKKYQTYLSSHTLYGSFRCGLAHTVSPKVKITLSSKDELEHLVKHNGGKLNLKVEDFYIDFKNACKHVINRTYPSGNKMNDDFLYVPGDSFNAGTDIEGGMTGSIEPPTKPSTGSTIT